MVLAEERHGSICVGVGLGCARGCGRGEQWVSPGGSDSGCVREDREVGTSEDISEVGWKGLE